MSLVEILQTNSIGRDFIAAVVGLCIGSFLNVLAIRSLEERSIIFPPSSCPHCKHRLGQLDMIPVLSWLMLGGKCRYCKGPIHWQYPVVELFTAITFVVLVHQFAPNIADQRTVFELDALQQWGTLLGMLVFSCTLIAVCVTDFRERLIPHEITYPSMIAGIIFSATVNNEAVGLPSALMGIGVSYILFDFIAFYGLKLYIAMHGDPDLEKHKKILTDRDHEGVMILPVEDVDFQLDQTFEVADESLPEEEFEVMGGGDAVLSAVISAWLGVQALSVALLVGFLAGTVMGASYLVHEMYQRKVLKRCLWPSLLGMVLVVTLVEGLLLFVTHLSPPPDSAARTEILWLHFKLGLIAAFCGALLGVLRTGREYSKPFPFGPALAFGAAVAMLYKAF